MKNKQRVRNSVKTYRVETLSYRGPGLVEDTTWKLAGIRNQIEDVSSMMESDYFMRAFEIIPDGGSQLVMQNF